MKDRITAIIVDPDKDKHDYETLKTNKIGDYDEEGFDLKVLDSTERIRKVMYEYKHYDAIITIGVGVDFTPLSECPFEVRKKWIHFDEFDGPRIANAIMYSTMYNIGRKRNKGETLVSVFTCCFNTPYNDFMRLYNSLCEQTYKNWNWYILDDSSTSRGIEPYLKELKDERIVCIRNVTNHGNIGFNKNAIAMMCDGDYLVEIDHDDKLTKDCLEMVATAFDDNPEVGFVYSNCLEILNDRPVVYGDGNETWGNGEGWNRMTDVEGEKMMVSIEPNITPHSIRSIHLQPNHVRAWRSDVYHQIGGHAKELSVLDDMEVMVRTFLVTRMLKIERVLYYQNEGYGVRGGDAGTTQSKRFGEIQRTDWWLAFKYDKQIHDRIIELGFEDTAWDEKEQESHIWVEHTPTVIMNKIMEFDENGNYYYVPDSKERN